MRILVLLLLMVPMAGEATTLRVARQGAKIRAATGFDAAVLAMPPRDAPLELLETQNEWRRVRLADGTEGYIHELYVAEAEPPAEASRAVASPPPSAVAESSLPVEDEVAPATSPPGAPRDRVIEVGELKARVAALETELRSAKGRAATAERSAMEATDALERERDEHASAERELREECEERVAQAQQVVEAAKAGVSGTATLKADNERLEQALAAAGAEKSEAVARCEAEHRQLYDTYVEIVSQRHEQALARDREAQEAACREHQAEIELTCQRRLASARRESGWEADFEQELRERTELAVSEAKARWEAKQRGDQYDEERVRRDEAAKVRAACDGERLSAVSSALEVQRAEMEARIASEREASDARCQVALEIVLERAAAGEDVSDMREAAARSRERLDAAHAPPTAPPTAPPPAPVP